MFLRWYYLLHKYCDIFPWRLCYTFSFGMDRFSPDSLFFSFAFQGSGLICVTSVESSLLTKRRWALISAFILVKSLSPATYVIVPSLSEVTWNITAARTPEAKEWIVDPVHSHPSPRCLGYVGRCTGTTKKQSYLTSILWNFSLDSLNLSPYWFAIPPPLPPLHPHPHPLFPSSFQGAGL